MKVMRAAHRRAAKEYDAILLYLEVNASRSETVSQCRRSGERMRSETPPSLCEIGEAMGFRNEYYFNAFCKKYVGLPPGVYRRAILKT